MKLPIGTLIEIPKKEPLMTYKKLDFNLNSPIYRFKYAINKIYVNKDFDDNPLHKETKRFYSILPSALSKIDYNFGLRFFEVEIWGKCVVENKMFIGSEYIHLKREMPLKEMLPFLTSKEAYSYCYDFKDTEEIREKIVEEKWIYNYLTLIKNREEMTKLLGEVWKERYEDFRRHQTI